MFTKWIIIFIAPIINERTRRIRSYFSFFKGVIRGYSIRSSVVKVEYTRLSE